MTVTGLPHKIPDSPAEPAVTLDVDLAYGFLPFQRKDRTIKPWDQTPSALPDERCN
jgi:hypothetical protein